jgi:hypothetical protein
LFLPGTKIIRKDIDETEIKLKTFLRQFEAFYGTSMMTYNIHVTQHLCETVRMCGPLCVTSNFPFERKNGSLKRKVKGSSDVIKQIATKTGYEVYRHLNDKKSVCNIQNNILCVGKTAVNVLHRIKLDQLFSESNIQVEQFESDVQEYATIIINRVKYHSDSYLRSKKKYDSLVLLQNGSVGIIKTILKVLEKEQILIDIREVESTNFLHLKKLKNEANFKLLSPCLIVKKLILIKIDNISFFSEFPNSIEVE